ncbi:MAG: hypothetical protein GEU74_00725 [Nitriliruptorales bacterium]|nr:hypothetical protein [Nitriliruptorales bacterium]
MSVTPEEGLRLVDSTDVELDDNRPPDPLSDADADLETLRDEFVDAFNARDLDALLALASEDVECPDIHGDGVAALADEVGAIWERSPAAILTRGFLEGEPCAVGWLPDEEGCWSRAALVTFAGEQGLLSVVSVPDDVDALERADAEDPSGEEQDEGTDWSEWDSGEARAPRDRVRNRP